MINMINIYLVVSTYSKKRGINMINIISVFPILSMFWKIVFKTREMLMMLRTLTTSYH